MDETAWHNIPSPAVRKSERGLSPRRGKITEPLFFLVKLDVLAFLLPKKVLIFLPLLGERSSEARVRGNVS